MDLPNKTDAELDEMRRAIGSEIRRRARMGASPERLDQTVREYQEEVGIKDGDDWVNPATALTRPMKGAKRTHKGKLWRSTIDHNVFEPGVSGWKLEAETDPETGETIYPPFNRPSGAHDAYEAGDRITWTDGEVYEAKRDGVEWDPGNAPGDWAHIIPATPIEPAPEPGPEPEPPEEEEPEPGEGEPVDPEEPEPGDGEGDEDDEPEPEPEPEPEGPALPEWKIGVDYQPGDTFTYQGVVYTVLQAHTSAAHWPPDAVASLYERQ